MISHRVFQCILFPGSNFLFLFGWMELTGCDVDRGDLDLWEEVSVKKRPRGEIARRGQLGPGG